MPTLRHNLLAIFLGMAVALAACGSSEDDPTATETAVSATPDPTSAEPSPAPSTQPAAPTSADSSTPAGEPAAAATLTIAEFAFSPPTTVEPGATVAVENSDGVLHTVSADDGSFDVQVPAGSTGSFTAPTEPGDYSFVCNLHASMSAVLTVG